MVLVGRLDDRCEGSVRSFLFPKRFVVSFYRISACSTQFESYRLHGCGSVPDRGHAKPRCFDDSRDSKNDSIFGARREIQRRRRHAPSCMGATELQSNWPEMRKTLGKPGFCSTGFRKLTERIGTELFDVFPTFSKSSKST